MARFTTALSHTFRRTRARPMSFASCCPPSKRRSTTPTIASAARTG